MWTPIFVKATNFRTYKDLERIIKKSGIHSISGENESNDGQESNGAGKSNLAELIYVNLTSDILRPSSMCSLKDVVSYGEKECEIFVRYENSKNDVLEIKRNIFSNTKSAKLEIFLNKKPQKFESVRKGNELILDIIGVQKTDIDSYFIISLMKSNESFLLSGDSYRKKVISRFSSADLIDPKIEKVKTDIHCSQVYIKEDLQPKLEVLTGKLDTYKSIDDQSNDSEDKKLFEEEKKQALTDLKKQASDKKVKIKSFTNEVSEIEKELGLENKRILEIKSTEEIEGQISELEKEIEEIQNSKTEEESKLNEVSSKINKINILLKNAISCPKCNFTFSVSKDKKYSKQKLEKYLSVYNEKEERYKNLILDKNESLKEIKNNRSKLREKVEEEKLERKKINRNIKHLKEEKEDLLSRINQYKKEVLKLKEIFISKKEEEYQPKESYSDKISELEKEIEEIKKKIEDEEEKLSNKKQLIPALTSFKAHLINKVLGAIESFANDSLVKMQSDMRVYISGYKKNKNGDLSEKIDIRMERKGIEGPIGNLSSGELVRVDLAVSVFAIQDLINMNCEEGLDYTVLDEKINSLDSKGHILLNKSLANTGKTIDTITHSKINQVQEGIEKIIVTKINDISTIKC